MAGVADGPPDGDWLDGKAYYRARFIVDTIDNPDQRIQYDIDIFTAKGAAPNVPHTGTEATLLFGAINAVLSVISFTAILWDLSGTTDASHGELSAPEGDVLDPADLRDLRSIIAFWVGRPIIWLSFRNEKFNAAFRYALVRLRDASEAVAFYRGEIAERTGLRKLFAPIVANYKRWINRMMVFYGWNLVDESDHRRAAVSVPVPAVLQRRNHPRRNEPVGLGVRPDRTGLSFFRNAYDAVRRLSRVDHPPRWAADRERRRKGAAGDHDHALQGRHGAARGHRGPDARRETARQAARLASRSRRHVGGDGRIGVRQDHAVAQPRGVVAVHHGTLTRPCGPNETMFLSQMPYVPLGDLRAVVSYPLEEGDVDDDTLKTHAGEGGAAAPRRTARRSRGLGEGPLPGRTAASRVRPDIADQTQGGLP